MSKTTVIILIVVAVLLIALYLSGLILGAGGGGCSAPTLDAVREYAESYGETQPVTQRDLRWKGGTGSWNRREIPPGRQVILEILHVAAERDRKVSLETQHPVDFVGHRSGYISVPTKIRTKGEDDQTIDLQFDEKGGTIEMTCKRSGDPCRITVK